MKIGGHSLNVMTLITEIKKKAVKDGLAEDEQKNAEAKLQNIHDKYIKQIDDMLAEKDKEIMTV